MVDLRLGADRREHEHVPYPLVERPPRTASRPRTQLPQPREPLNRTGVGIPELRPERLELLHRVQQRVPLERRQREPLLRGFVGEHHQPHRR